MDFMKRHFSIFIASAAAAFMAGCTININSSSGWSSADLKAVTNIVQSAQIPANLKALEVNNAFGAIRITGADNGDFKWTQRLTVHARTDAEVQKLAGELVCRASLIGDRLEFTVTAPDSREPHSFQSDLEITVPKSVVVRTHDEYGATEISAVDGDVEAANKFGALELRNIAGKVRGETSYAALKVNHTGPATLKNQFGAIDAKNINGPLDAETSYAVLEASDISGSVNLRNQFGAVRVEQAGAADLKTSYAELSAKKISGDARLVNRFGRVNAEAVSGAVKAETSYGTMDIDGPGGSFVCNNRFGAITVRATSTALTNLDARTSYAALTVRLPASLKPAIQAHTSYADIESDFPVLMKPRGQDPFAGLQPDTPRINLQNQNGKIRVISE